jgi:hypothetical protein
MKILDRVLSSHVYEPISEYLRDSKTNYLEIGVFNGAGLVKIATDNPNILCEAVDPFIEDGHTTGASQIPTGKKMSAQHNSTVASIDGLENVNLNVMTSHQYFAELTEEKITTLNIGTVLIDGNHHYEFVVNDYKLAMAVIANKAGLIVFDDLGVPGVAQAFNQFCEEHADRIEKQMPIASGVAMTVFIKEVL